LFRRGDQILPGKAISAKRVAIDWGEEDSEEMDADASPAPGKLYVEFRLEDADGLFSVRERSLGFRWFFVYLLLTTYRGRRQTGSSDLLFLFDEPASNLHSTAQSALLASLEELSHQASIIYTTHSHHLIQPAWLGSTFVVVNEGVDPRGVSDEAVAQRTDIRVEPYRSFAAQHPSQSHFFQPILDVLDYAPSQLELVPSVVMVEGKTDFYFLAYFQEVVLAGEDGERLNFLPGGGAGTLDGAIQLYLGWGRPFVAMLDSDRAGVREAKRYVDKFGPILSPRLLTLAEATGDSSAKGIESLLSDRDRLAIQRVTDPTATVFDKKAFARGVQEALAGQKMVSVSVSGKRKVLRLFRTLEARLTGTSS
jgi:hypothetical protein